MAIETSTPANPLCPIDASMLNGLSDPVFLADQGLSIVDCNQAARDLFGDTVVGTKVTESLCTAEVMETIEVSLSGRPAPQQEIFLPPPVARSYQCSVWRLPDLKSSGPAWVMVVFHDVTAMKKADQMRADFVSNVSHELRSPLSSLLGFIETLRGPARDDEKALQRFLGIMESEAQRMTRLINDLLTLSKVESDEHIRPKNTVDLKSIVAEVITVTSIQAKQKGMEISVKQPPVLPLVNGNRDELTQVFQNLIANAISYGYEKTVVDVVLTEDSTVTSTEPGGVSVAVVNRGDGIASDEIPRLTERFYRVDKGRSRSMGGTGLGLAIVKHIVARHRGHLEIKSEPMEATTFKVILPGAKT